MIMARRNIIIGASLALAAFAAGLFIGRGGFGARDDGAHTIAFDRETPSTERNAPNLRGFEEVRPDDAPREALDTRPKSDQFAFDGLNLDTSTETPRACFRFSHEVDVSGKTNYADYVSFKPALKTAAEPAGKSVCFSGLAFDTDYQATLKKGLPGVDGVKLASSEKLTVAFGDKPAYVGFVGNGVILPRMEADGIGFETVNVDRLQVKIYRVGDRALSFKRIVEGDNAGDNQYGAYSYGDEDGTEYGVPLFDDVLTIKADINDREVTVFPLGAALGKARQESGNAGLKPGAYYIELRDASDGAHEYRPARAWRWVMFTDMALTSYNGADGIDVIVRSLETARPMAGVDVSLLARNNDVLAKVKSDGDGFVRFPGPVTRGKGVLAPRMIMAYGDRDDFAVIDLDRSPLDLSDQDVAGRTANAAVDSYLYFDRGIYRPGETVHIAGILRDGAGIAIEARPATLSIYRPNGTEAASVRLDTMSIGGFSHSWDVPSSAPRGTWRVAIKPDGLDATQSESFSVEDFVPQRVAVDLKAAEKTPILSGEKREVNIIARFLYGAPGSGLNVEGEARLRLDPNPFPTFKDYAWGDQQADFSERRLRLGETVTDGDGKATLSLGIDKTIVSNGRPLRADIVVGVAEPGGRFVNESARIPVRVDKRYIGIKPSDEQKTGANEAKFFDLVMVDADGAQVSADKIEWRIIEEDYNFHWYRHNGEWRWRRDYRDILIATDTTSFTTNKATRLSRQLDYGAYRLEVEDTASGAMASYRFYIGWRSYASGANTPDKAVLTLPQEPVKAGSRTKITVAAPYAGEALITVATDKVHSVQRIKLDGKPREITIETDASWGAGFYVMATVVTPRDAVNQPVPRRAMGVAYVPLDMSARKLAMSFDMPDKVRPRQKINLPMTIDGAQGGEEFMLTLAAVDEGILRLTKFQSPSPVDYFFGKKRLGVRVYDDYGRLLNPNLAAATNFGGDQLGGEGLSVVPVKSVALFSGLVKATGSGRITVPIEVPDFNGELRLMAVAWSKTRLGSVDQALTVRDAVPAEISLPRFLAPGDTANATLLIDNVEGAAGDYQVTLDGSGPVGLAANRSFTLNKGQREDALFPLTVGDTGIGRVSLAVEGPGGFKVARGYPIQSRAPWFPVTEVKTASQGKGETFRLDSKLASGYLPGSLELKVSYSPLKGIDPQSLLDSLYRYPYGCTEQLTSSAWPLLYADRLGGLTGDGAQRELRPRVQKAIDKILARQSPDGAFGLWRVNDRYATGWIGAYVTDFLMRAKANGYAVPDTAMEAALHSMQKMTSTDRWISVSYTFTLEEGTRKTERVEKLRREAAAYAYYVLARAGKADLSDMRYFHDSFLIKVSNPLSRMQIGAALAMMGDKARAANAFKLAEAAVNYNDAYDYYQSPLRDIAGMITIAADLENRGAVDRLLDKLSTQLRSADQLNTQQKAFLLMASGKLIDQAGDMRISVDGKSAQNLGHLPSFVIDPERLEGGMSFANAGEGTVYRSVTIYGVPTTAPPAVGHGFKLNKSFRTLAGKPVTLSALRQNDRVIVHLTGAPTDYQNHASIVVDMLPAGLEIEQVLSTEDAGKNGVYRWLGDLSRPKVAEARDDRFVAAIDLKRYKNSSSRRGQLNLAYVARVVTPGEFSVPGAVIEDMYRAGEFARTSQQRMTIKAAQ